MAFRAGTQVNKIKRGCLSFIPECVSDKAMLRVFRIMGDLDGYSLRRAVSDYGKNLKVWKSIRASVCGGDGFIEDQKALGQIRFGVCSAAYSGCEVIAVYNALNDIFGGNKKVSLPKLIMYFELNGMTMRGRFGTSPEAVEEYLICQGFSTCAVTDADKYDDCGSRFHTFILTMYNDRGDISKGVHTVAITKEMCSLEENDMTAGETGQPGTVSGECYIMHNAGGRKMPPCDSIGECVMKYSAQARPIMLIGISRMQKQT